MNNYGLGTRDLAKAGAFAVNATARAGHVSYSTAATVGERWQVFGAWVREQGIKRLEQIDQMKVEAFGRHLAEQVRAGSLSPAYAQNLVSAVNSVMNLATQGQWQSVSPTRDCDVAQRNAVRELAPTGYDRADYQQALAVLRVHGMERQAAVAGLAREFGLRSKEASLLNARAALAEARKTGVMTVVQGTKGGRSRQVPVSSPSALRALKEAATLQGTGRNLIPEGMSWQTWREGDLRHGREALQAQGIDRYHDLRAAYACERYMALQGHAPPVLGGKIIDQTKDRETRLQIARELGHGRIDVVAEYVGGRR